MITVKLSTRRLKGYDLLCAPGETAHLTNQVFYTLGHGIHVVVASPGGIGSKPLYIKVVDTKAKVRIK